MPLIVDLRLPLFDLEDHPDLLSPLQQKFSTALTMAEVFRKLPEKIYQLSWENSLWEKHSPPKIVQNAIKYIYEHLSDVNLGTCEIAEQGACKSKKTLERKFNQWSMFKKFGNFMVGISHEL